jgi:hypothetical protein
LTNQTPIRIITPPNNETKRSGSPRMTAANITATIGSIYRKAPTWEVGMIFNALYQKIYAKPEQKIPRKPIESHPGRERLDISHKPDLAKKRIELNIHPKAIT